MRALLLFIHLAGVVVWVGGMFFAHFCLRPVLAEQLPPAQRLPVLAAVLGRFFRSVAFAVFLIIVSGVLIMGGHGFASMPPAWHGMATLGLIMAGIFLRIYLIDHARLRHAVAKADWPAGGQAMNRIRQLVTVNLVLAVLTLAVATLGYAVI